MQQIGRIEKLQLQRSRLKLGKGDARTYDPEPIQQMPAIYLTADGVLGVHNGAELLDIHHIRHPNSVNRRATGKFNAISFNFTSHYRQMGDRFGERGADGFGGENILIATETKFALDMLSAGIVIIHNGQKIHLEQVSVAHPCVPFSSFMLGMSPKEAQPKLKETLQFLDAGMRGFLCHWAGEPVTIAVGNAVYSQADVTK